MKNSTVVEEGESSPLILSSDSMNQENNNSKNNETSKQTISLKDEMKNHWWAVLLGQGIALSSASTNASSYMMINDIGVVFPIFQTGIAYTLLSLHLLDPFTKSHNNREGQQFTLEKNGPRTIQTLKEKEEEETNVNENYNKLPFTNLHLRMSWWIYFLIAFLDVQANFLIMLSFRYTSLTSTTLLLSLTTPATMIISRHMLSRTFSFHHFVGVFLCMLGGTMTVWNDLEANDSSGDDITQQQNSHSYLGDLLAIAGAISYGLTDTVAEYFVKHVDRKEYLGMLGLFGAMISFIQSPIIGEWNVLVSFCTRMSKKIQLQAAVTLMWYIGSVTTYYISVSYFLAKSDATLLNLSLQAAQLWAILFTVVAESVVPPPMFFAATVLVILGVFIYEIEHPFQAIINSFKLRKNNKNKSDTAVLQEMTFCPDVYGSLTSSDESIDSLL